MTREAIETLKENVCALCAYGSQNMDSCDIRGCDNRDAIKTLEQESVLDKIRAEIEQKARPNEIGGRGNEKSIRYGLCMALEIIDKYRTESEGRNDT